MLCVHQTLFIYQLGKQEDHTSQKSLQLVGVNGWILGSKTLAGQNLVSLKLSTQSYMFSLPAPFSLNGKDPVENSKVLENGEKNGGSLNS